MKIRLIAGVSFAVILILVGIFALTDFLSVQLRAQEKMSGQTLDEALVVLQDSHEFVKKYYYDPKFHDLDWDARYRDYKDKIKNATSLSQAFSVVASFLDGLNDSHTFFIPPSRPFRVDYGFRLAMVGDNCFIWRIRPGTDAAEKLSLGDQVLSYDNFGVNRANFSKMEYYFNALAPMKASILALRDPQGKQRTVTVDAKVRELKQRLDLTGGTGSDQDIWSLYHEAEDSQHYNRQRAVEIGDLTIWKMPSFNADVNEVDRFFSIAKKHKTLVLDLRGNPGGAISTLEHMLGNVFDHDVKIADRVERKGTQPDMARSRGNSAFQGKLIVLLDSSSASAAELFARVVQLEKRGIVLGDHSSGHVMESRHYRASQGMNTIIAYGFSITEADMVMADGKSLEHTGVTPDEIILPTAQDLGSGRDPVLTRAAELAGVKLDPVEAGKLFPFEWMPI